MFHKFYPYEYADSVLAIDFQKLYDSGYHAIVFDIDNTLVPHGADSTDEVDQLFRDLHRIGFQTLLLSNNDEPRVRRFLKNIDSLYICDAEKPDVAGYQKAVELLHLPVEHIVCIGDQVFTDIYGANKLNMPSILVHYIQKPGETRIGIRRRLEQVVLFFYRHNRKYQHRIGNILLGE